MAIPAFMPAFVVLLFALFIWDEKTTDTVIIKIDLNHHFPAPDCICACVGCTVSMYELMVNNLRYVLMQTNRLHFFTFFQVCSVCLMKRVDNNSPTHVIRICCNLYHSLRINWNLKK